MIETIVRCDAPKCRRILNGSDVAIVVPTDLGTVYTTKAVIDLRTGGYALGEKVSRPDGVVHVCNWACYQTVVGQQIIEAIAKTRPPGTPVEEGDAEKA